MIGWALQRAHLFLLRHTVQPLPLPSLAIHCLTAIMPALTVRLSANALGSALGGLGVRGGTFCCLEIIFIPSQFVAGSKLWKVKASLCLSGDLT